MVVVRSGGAIPSGSIPARRLLLFSSQGRFDFVQSRIMKAIATLVFCVTSLLVAAQTSVPKGAALPEDWSAHAAAVRTSSFAANPASLKAKAPAVFKAKFTTIRGRFCGRGPSRLGAHGAGPFLQLCDRLATQHYFTNRGHSFELS